MKTNLKSIINMKYKYGQNLYKAELTCAKKIISFLLYFTNIHKILVKFYAIGTHLLSTESVFYFY